MRAAARSLLLIASTLTACARPAAPPVSAAPPAIARPNRCPEAFEAAPRSGSDPSGATALGLRVAEGFRITQVAGSDVVDDLHALAFDRDGRLLVSGPGAIRSLGCARRAVTRADVRTILATASGAMSLAPSPDGVYASVDGGLSFIPYGADGALDGAHRTVLLEIAHGEHGAHHVLQGPDGAWLGLVGNEERVRVPAVDAARSPIVRPRAGFVLRWSRPRPDALVVLSEGLRNPYRFDVTADGDVLTYDSDGEREVSLPWYLPTRVLAVDVAGGDQGWLPQGWTRSWPLPLAYADRVDMLAPIGRGSPTGVAVYRAALFPSRYRGGLFIADWTFGRILFVPLTRDGAGVRAGAPETFLSSVGTEGFAPSDLTVGPDGALWVTIGGRRTRGGVFRIAPAAPAPRSDPADALGAVLGAPQPLAAWSRGRWEPAARALGSDAIARAALDRARSVDERVRAIEIAVDLWGERPAAVIAADPEPRLRARAAWALGRAGVPLGSDGAQRLAAAARDRAPLVRARALEAIGERWGELDRATRVAALAANLGSPDRRLRGTAIAVATRLDRDGFAALADATASADVSTRLGTLPARGGAHRRRGVELGELAREALALAPQASTPRERLDVVRAIVLGLGDLAFAKPAAEAFSLYELPSRPAPAVRAAVLAELRPRYPSGDAELDAELARLFALLEDDDPGTRDRVLAALERAPDPASAVHLLVVLARLGAPLPPRASATVAGVLLGLRARLGADAERNLGNWDARLVDVVRALLPRAPSLAAALAARPESVRAAHLPLVAVLPEAQRRTVAARLVRELRSDSSQPLSPAALDLLALLPRAQIAPVLRAHASELAVRDRIVELLRDVPAPSDRATFVAALRSASAAPNALAALAKLPRPGEAERVAELRALLALHGRLDRPTDAALRRRVRDRIAALAAGEPAPSVATDPRADHVELAAWIERRVPALATSDGGPRSPEAWLAVLSQAPKTGDVARGEKLVRERACLGCHGGSAPLGPSLVGAAQRMSREDLLIAIVDPSRDVSALYQPTVIETRDGGTLTGLVTYEAEVVLLRTDPSTLQRVPTTDIARRQPSEASMMPEGLLEGLGPSDLADLFAYLATLR